MPAIKDSIPWNKGLKGYKNKPCTKETKKNISKANKGKKRTIKHKENISNGTKKAMQKDEVKIKLKATNHKGKNNSMYGKLGKDNPNYGRKNTEETKRKMSLSQIKILENKKPFGNCFKRTDLGHLCRSKYEANFLRIQKYLGNKYLYEPKVFKLSNGRHYKPDVYMIDTDMFIELKGYEWPGTKEKIALFRKDYPKIKLVVIKQNSEQWKRMEKEFEYEIDNWERYK